jgi:acyl-CoA synthetase (AMP-forming)/AMP-acid ligase II
MDFLIHHMLRTSAMRFPEKEALVHGEQRLTYGAVASQVAGLACGLREAGLQRGDRLGIYFDPSIPQVLSIFGIAQAGGVFVPINHLLFPDQVAHIARLSYEGAYNHHGQAGYFGKGAKHPSLEFLVVLQDTETPDVALPVHSFEEFCQAALRARGVRLALKKTWRRFCILGVDRQTQSAMLSHARDVRSSIVSTYLGITAAERILAVLPFSFDAGMNQLMTAFQQGGTLVLSNFVFAREIVQGLLQERITGLAGVPTLWSLLAQPSSSLQQRQLPHLRYITNTGGAMPQPVLATLRRLLPTTKIFLMYGLTEAFRSTYLPPEELEHRPTPWARLFPTRRFW